MPRRSGAHAFSKRSRSSAPASRSTTPSGARSQIKFVSKQKLRQLFSDTGCEAGVVAGTVRIDVLKSRPGPLHQQPGALSQIVSYVDLASGRTIAKCHRYLNPDGSLGASGRPDPKMVNVKGVLYATS
jgi:hypothetical protein